MWANQKVIKDFASGILQGRTLFYLVILVFFAKVFIFLIFVPFPQNIFFADITKTDLLNLLNSKRQSVGLSQLKENGALNIAAELKAKDMIEKEYFSHQSPEGVIPWFWIDRVNYKYEYAGENLAIGFINSSDVQNAWLNSPSHRANLLSEKYTDIGMAIASGFGANSVNLVVQIYANPAKKPIIPATVTQNKTKKLQVEKSAEEEKVQANPVNSKTDDKKVLSGSYLTYLSEPTGNEIYGNIYQKFINFIAYDGQNLLSAIALFLAAIVILLLFMATFPEKVYTHKKLLFKSQTMLIVLLASLAINKSIILGFLPTFISAQP